MPAKKDLKVRISGDDTSFSRAAKRVDAITGRLGNRLKSVAVTAGKFTAAIGAFAFGVDRAFLRPLRRQEDALASLGQALTSTGKDGAAALDRLAKSAAELQKVSRFGDEAIIEATSTLATLAPALAVDELERAQSALVGLADTFFKGDVNAAAQILGKTLGSTTNALTRYGIQVDTSASASDKLAQIMGSKQLGAAFDVALAKSQTLGGRMEQLGNITGDLREFFGGVIVEAAGLTDGAGNLSERLSTLGARLENNRESWVAWTRVGLGSTKAVAISLGALVRIAFNVGQGIGRAFDIAANTLAGTMLRATEIVRVDWRDLADTAQKLFDWADLIPDIDFSGSEATSSTFFDAARTQAENLRGDIEDIEAATLAVGGAWTEVIEAIDAAQVAAGSGGPATPGAGGGGGGGGPLPDSIDGLAVSIADLQAAIVALGSVSLDPTRAVNIPGGQATGPLSPGLARPGGAMVVDVGLLHDAFLRSSPGNFLDVFGGELDQLGPTIEETTAIFSDVTRQTEDVIESWADAGSAIDRFIDDVPDSIKSQFDVGRILEGAAGNLLAGGVSSIVGAGLGALFGERTPSPEEVALRQAIEHNSERVAELTRTFSESLARTTRGEEFTLGPVISDAIAQAERELAAQLPPGARIPRVVLDERFVEILTARLTELGFSIEDVEDLAERLKINFDRTAAAGERLAEALATLDLVRLTETFSGALGLLQTEFELLDIDDPMEQVRRILGTLEGSISEELFNALTGAIDADEFDAFIETFLADIRSGEFDPALLKELNLDEFLSVVGILENNFDSLSDAVAGTTNAMRNVPAGFKAAAAIFDATDAVPQIPFDTPFGPRFPYPKVPGIPFGPKDTDGGGITVHGDIVVNANGVSDPVKLVDGIEREIVKRSRRGGSHRLTPTTHRSGGS